MKYTERIKDAWQCLKGNAPKYVEYKRESFDVSLHRVGSIDERSAHYIEKMSEDEYREHRSDMSTLAVSAGFQKELEALKLAQVYEIARQFYDEKWHYFAKGTLNGIGIVQDRFNNLHSEELKQREEDKKKHNFDPFDSQIYE